MCMFSCVCVLIFHVHRTWPTAAPVTVVYMLFPLSRLLSFDLDRHLSFLFVGIDSRKKERLVGCRRERGRLMVRCCYVPSLKCGRTRDKQGTTNGPAIPFVFHYSWHARHMSCFPLMLHLFIH